MMTKIKNKNVLSCLYGQKGLSDSYIDFQVALAEITEKYKKIAESQPVVLPGQDIIDGKFEEGFSLITFTPVTLFLKDLTAAFREILPVFRTHKVCSPDTADWVKEKMDSRFLAGITEAIISFDFDVLKDLAEPTPFDVPTLALSCGELVKPFFHALAGQAGGAVDFAKWTEGYCPICGDAPSLSRFSKKEDGKRYLWCSRCDFEWTFQRVCCPFCKNSDHTKLKFLTTDFREELRLDVCEKCKGYIKTVDGRKIDDEEPIVFLKENAASIYLDILAEEKGFTKQLPSFQDAQIKFSDDFDGYQK
jgi:FdhE protein